MSKQPLLHNTELESHGARPREGCNAQTRGMPEKLFLTTPGKQQLGFHSLLAGMPPKATSSGMWPGPRTKQELQIPVPGATTLAALTGKDFRNGFTRSCDSNLEYHSDGPSPRRNTAPQPLQVHPVPPSWVGRTLLVPLQPDLNLLELRAVTSLWQWQSQPAAHPLGSKINPGSSGKPDPKPVCTARRGISRKGGMSPSMRHRSCTPTHRAGG